MIDLVGVDSDFIIDTRHLRRHVLANTVKVNLHAAVLKMNHGRYAFDAFDHASGKRGQQKLGRIECIRAAGQVRVQDDFSPFTSGDAAVSVRPTTGHGVL